VQGNKDLLHLWLINMKLSGLYRLSNSLVLAIFHLSNLFYAYLVWHLSKAFLLYHKYFCRPAGME
jgi:hypothetical protein